MLDGLLDSLFQLQAMSDFIALTDRKRFALVKLHGSITWCRKIESKDNGIPRLGSAIQQRRADNIDDLRTWREDHYVGPGFPSISVPLGSEDDLSCPDYHAEFLVEQFRAARDNLKMMVIGYSGLDQALIRLLGESESPVRELRVVDQDHDSAAGVISRIEQGIEVLNSEPAAEDFAAFAENGSLVASLIRLSENG